MNALKNSWKSWTVWINGLVIIAVIAAKVAQAKGYPLDPALVSALLSAFGLDLPVTGDSLSVALNALLVLAMGNLGLRAKTTKPLSEK